MKRKLTERQLRLREWNHFLKECAKQLHAKPYPTTPERCPVAIRPTRARS